MGAYWDPFHASGRSMYHWPPWSRPGSWSVWSERDARWKMMGDCSVVSVFSMPRESEEKAERRAQRDLRGSFGRRYIVHVNRAERISARTCPDSAKGRRRKHRLAAAIYEAAKA
jgi:hypothetical protein